MHQSTTIPAHHHYKLDMLYSYTSGAVPTNKLQLLWWGEKDKYYLV